MGDEELQGLGIVHFYGDRKPWSKVRARLSSSLKAAQERWLQVYKSLDTGASIVLHDNILPLTQAGSEQYAKARILYGNYLSDGYYLSGPTSSPAVNSGAFMNMFCLKDALRLIVTSICLTIF